MNIEINKLKHILRRKIINDAILKPVHLFSQFDVFLRNGDINPDLDGDSIFFSQGHFELSRSDCLRVMVPEYAGAEETVRGLLKVIFWLVDDANLLPADAPDKHHVPEDEPYWQYWASKHPYEIPFETPEGTAIAGGAKPIYQPSNEFLEQSPDFPPDWD